MNGMLENYTGLINFFSKALGPDFEVIFIDITSKKYKVLSQSYGQILSDSIDKSVMNLIDKSIADREYENSDYIVNRATVDENGRTLRTSIYFVKGDEDELEGVMCIIFNDMRYEEISQKIMRLCHPDKYYESEISHISQKYIGGSNGTEFIEKASIEDTIELIADEELRKLEIPVERLTSDEKIEIIKNLDSKGVFMMKGAVNIMSKKLDISQASVYRYISIAREE